MKLTSKIRNYQIELCTFVYLAYLLLVTAAEEINGWVAVWYATDYSIGFSSRLLLGSVLKWFYPDYLPANAAYRLVIMTLLLICLLTALVFGKVYRKIKTTGSENGFLIFVLLYLASPASPAYLWSKENMGRLETFLVLFSLIILLICMNIGSHIVRYLLYSLLGVLCVALHQAYVFLFLPLLAAILVVELYENKWKKQNLVGAVVTMVIIGGTFLFFQFSSRIYYDDYLKLTEVIQSKTDLYVCDGTLQQEYFWEIKQHFVNNMLPDLRQRLRFGALTILALSPVFLFYAGLWKTAFQRASAKTDKRKYILIWLTNLAYVPIFALMTDWERWWGAFFTVQIFIIAVLAFKKDENILFALERVFAFAKKNWFLVAGIVLYLCTLDKFQGINNMDQVEIMYYKIYDFRMFIQSLFS